jgi:2-polyprenyl-6-methoxyphenol hydroxylase-like FAD-dependent oxidoreductase
MENVIDALIVGAGPTGLALASELNRRGIRRMLLDRLDAGRNTSRAADLLRDEREAALSSLPRLR